MRPGKTSGSGFRLSARGGSRAAVGLCACSAILALALPALAVADSSVAQVKDGQLRIDGVPGTPSMVEISYQSAAEAGFGGVSDRFLVADAGGAVALGADCAAVDPTHVSCDARPVLSITAALGDGDDVMVVDASKGAGVPRRYAARALGQAGADVLRGGLADDLLRGDRGRDVVAGWSGDDILFGGKGSDGLIGFEGDDTLRGEQGRDALFGQKGRDLMFGGAQNDVLLARDGTRDPQLACGPGKRQRAITDRHDPRASRCLQPEPKGKKKK